MDKIRIIIVDDDVAWVKKLNNFLNAESDFLVVGTTTDKSNIKGLVESVDVDIILMDLDLGHSPYDGIECIKELSEIKPLKFIIVTSYSVEDLIIQAFSAGAVHFFPKTYYTDIPNAIRLTYQNASPVEILLKNFFTLKKEIALKSLSNTERELFGYIEKGLSIREIAEILQKAEGTIKLQVHSILKKLDVKTRKQAIMKYK